MSPPCRFLSASELPIWIQEDVHGRRRKLDGGSEAASRKIDLSACELLQMLQYECEVQKPLSRNGAVRCYPIERLFRKCRDKKGTFMVETTAWEGESSHRAAQSKSPSRPDSDEKKRESQPQWSSNWHDR